MARLGSMTPDLTPEDLDKYGGDALQLVHALKPGEGASWGHLVKTVNLWRSVRSSS